MALDARQVKQDCAPKDSPLKAATAIVLGLASRGLLSSSLPLTIVSGGPKTPRECSAVQLAIAKAIQPWLAVHPGNKKIDTSDSSENVAQALPDAHRQGADQ